MGTGNFNSNQQRQPTETAQHQEEDIGPTLDLEHSCDEESDEEDRIPSDLSIEHHPRRSCEYTHFYRIRWRFNKHCSEATSNAATEDDSKWMISGICKTVQLAKQINPAQLSDIRLPLLNDVYIFDRNFGSSISKYFSTKIHTVTKPTLFFDTYLPTRDRNCYEWCMNIEASPKLYRMTNASKVKLFKNLDQMSLLPNVITHKMCLKEVASETASKIETIVLHSYSNLKCPASIPPLNWLSNDGAVLSRVSKKQKK